MFLRLSLTNLAVIVISLDKYRGYPTYSFEDIDVIPASDKENEP